ncbi:hypothetical protein HOD88_02265 [archaeon]|jgi:hypothetical protein|nr:hypothetical protein [archaeon]
MKIQKSKLFLILGSFGIIFFLTFGVFANSLDQNSANLFSLNNKQFFSSTIEESFSSLDITPFIQKTEDGSANYKLIVTDKHDSQLNSSYSYKLKFSSEDNLVGGIFNSEFNLNAGESKEFSLMVVSRNMGEGLFNVQLIGEDSNSSVFGKIIYLFEGQLSGDSFFEGKGYILSGNESIGYPLELSLLKNQKGLVGKALIDGEHYLIDGDSFSEEINFKLVRFGSEEELGSFSGRLIELGNLKIIKGIFVFKDSLWEVSLSGINEDVFPEDYEIEIKL